MALSVHSLYCAGRRLSGSRRSAGIAVTGGPRRFGGVAGQEDVDAEGLAGEAADLGALLVNLVRAEPGGADHAEAAGLRDRGHELRQRGAAGAGAHAGEYHRVFDAEHVTD